MPSDIYSENTLINFAIRLYDTGFNVIPVDASKKPLCPWSSNKRIDRAELEKLLEKASGIAIVGGSENPSKPASILVIVDVDDPRVLEESFFLKGAIGKTVRWYTGPRCPQCNNKHLNVLEPGRRFKCSKCNTEFTIGEARRGLGALFTVDHETYERYLKGTMRLGKVEFLVNNYQLIPPAIHPTGVKYEWIKQIDFNSPNLNIYHLTDTELENILEELQVEKKDNKEEDKDHSVSVEVKITRLRELPDSTILRVKELLKEAYKPGYRQYIVLYFSGWTAKIKIHPLPVIKIVKMLHDETSDTDSLKTRLSAVVYSYKKAGIDIDQFAREIEELTGVKPYGLEKDISESDIKGKSGLQEVLEEASGDEARALAIMKELEEILQSASPWTSDSVIELLDYEKQLYVVANLRKLIVVRARLENNKLIYKERVIIGAPTYVEEYVNPIGGVTKFKVIWEAETRPRQLVIGPATKEDIADRLKAEGLVVNTRLFKDVLNSLIEGYIKRGRVVVKEEIEAPGFYLITDKLANVEKLAVVGYNIVEQDKEKLREALELLNELAEKWFKHVIDKFAIVVKWGLIAPFSYVYKQKHRWIPWLYVYGASKTGKTTLGEIVLALWGLDAKHKKTGANIDTPARLGYVLSSSTFPVLINEPGNALNKEDIIEVLKNAIESTIVRGRYEKGVYTEYPALSPLIFTSNKYLPRDDALLRRLIVLRFTYGERIDDIRAKEFEANVKPKLNMLSVIGNHIANRIINEQSLLENNWDTLAEKLLEDMYKSVNIEPPQWIHTKLETKEDIYEDTVETIRSYLTKRINEEYTKFVGRVTVERPDSDHISLYSRSEVGFEDRVKIVIQNNLLPWAIMKEDKIYLTSEFAREITPLVGDIGGLKSIAELLGWVYEPRKTFRIGNKVTCMSVIETTIEELIAFLKPENQ